MSKMCESGAVRDKARIGSGAGVDRQWGRARVRGDVPLTVIKESPLCSREEKHWDDDETGAIPYGDGSDEQKRAGSADGSVSGPLDEAEEGLTVDRSGHREGDQSIGVSDGETW